MLLLLFIVVPLFEIYLFIEIGSAIGALPTILLIALTAVIGVSMLKVQGFNTLVRYRETAMRGMLPAFELIEGLLLLIGGALLLTPGFFTDAAGFLCLIPQSRKWMIPIIVSKLR